MCGCTDTSHQEARDAIRTQKLLTIDGVYRALGWRTPNGCSSCRPAINYYLLSSWPKEAVDDPQSRFINERVHANIQKDGTYSVVPRVVGGEITPDKLIVLGEVAKEFGLYTKITGGQRVDLFGAQLHQLPPIWRKLVDAGFETGHAYGKSLRTVKSCVGSTWCRFGVDDSVVCTACIRLC
mgnify:CR=1 FL=1